jgi:hypothetical protein
MVGMAQSGTHKKGRFPPKWAKAFLAALRETGNVGRACKAVPVGRRTAYHARTRDPNFANAWEEAQLEAGERMEEEARRRAHDGLVRY